MRETNGRCLFSGIGLSAALGVVYPLGTIHFNAGVRGFSTVKDGRAGVAAVGSSSRLAWQRTQGSSTSKEKRKSRVARHLSRT